MYLHQDTLVIAATFRSCYISCYTSILSFRHKHSPGHRVRLSVTPLNEAQVTMPIHSFCPSHLPPILTHPPPSSLSSKHPGSEIHNPNSLHNPTQPLHKTKMRRVLLQIILPILFILELNNEDVRYAALMTLGTVIPSAHGGFDIVLLRGRVNAFLFQGEEAGADLLGLLVYTRCVGIEKVGT